MTGETQAIGLPLVLITEYIDLKNKSVTWYKMKWRDMASKKLLDISQILAQKESIISEISEIEVSYFSDLQRAFFESIQDMKGLIDLAKKFVTSEHCLHALNNITGC